MTARWQLELASAIGAHVVAVEPIPGGDINETYRAQLASATAVFVKTHAAPAPGMYAAEAAGLDWLRAGPLRLPGVIAVHDSFLALEWLELGPRGRDFEVALGRGLATLHAVGAPCFGHAGASFLATLPQDNTKASDGPTFWIEQRVRPLARRAHAMGRMPDVAGKLDALLARRDRFGPDEPPARLHGDLWWGNVIAVDGEPVLIDPAVYGGHREVDLAMLALFGGVSRSLLAAYEEVAPLAADWRDRVALWQLYPLAAHAVLFGGGYGAQLVHALDQLA